MDAPLAKRCPACGKRSARRVPCAPSLVTDTNLGRGVTEGARVAGFHVETRADLRAMEAQGYGIVSKHDLEQAASASSTRAIKTRSGKMAYVSKPALEQVQRAMKKIKDANRITVR